MPLYTALVTVLAVTVYFYTGLRVANARIKFGVLPPATRRMPLRISAGHSRVTNGGVLDSVSVTLSTSTCTSSRSTSLNVTVFLPAGVAIVARAGRG